MGLFSSIFGSKTEQTPEEKQINKNFDILKYDGIRARNIGQICYAIKCFEQACVAVNRSTASCNLLLSYKEDAQGR